MTIEEVLKQMRWYQQWPEAQGWANEIEAAMTQPVAYLMENKEYPHLAQSLHFSPPEWHITWTPRPLFDFPPDAAGEIERLKEELQGPDGFGTWKDAALDERVRRVKAQAEIERLEEQLERERQQAREAIDAVRNGEPLGSIAGKHMIRNQQVEIERLNAWREQAKTWEREATLLRADLGRHQEDTEQQIEAMVRERDAEIERLREDIRILHDYFQNGVRHNEKRNVYELVWTERQLEKAKKEAERILAALAPKEPKP